MVFLFFYIMIFLLFSTLVPFSSYQGRNMKVEHGHESTPNPESWIAGYTYASLRWLDAWLDAWLDKWY